MIATTLNRIREYGPCVNGWQKLLRHLGKTEADDEPLPYSVIVKAVDLYDALWCCRVEPQHAAIWRHCAIDFAETVKHLMTDRRSIEVLLVARRHAEGAATDDELAAAKTEAWDAAAALTGGAASAAWAAAWAAEAAAEDAAGAAAGAAAEDAAGAVAEDAAGAVARAAAWIGMKEIVMKRVC